MIWRLICFFLRHRLGQVDGRWCCTRCGLKAPMCEWCGERMAQATAFSSDGKSDGTSVCWRCVGVP